MRIKELKQISSFSDRFLLFKNGFSFIPIIEKEDESEIIEPFLIIKKYEENDIAYDLESAQDIKITLFDYSIISEDKIVYKNFEVEEFLSWLFSKADDNSTNRDKCLNMWRKCNPTIPIKDIYSGIPYYYDFEKDILNNKDAYEFAKLISNPISEDEILNGCKVWVIKDKNKGIKEPHLRLYSPNNNGSIFISLYDEKLIYFTSSEDKQSLFDIYKKWRLKLEPDYLSCSNLSKAKRLWALFDSERGNYPNIWNHILYKGSNEYK